MWESSHRQSEIRVTHQGTPLVIGAALRRVAYPNGPDLYALGAGLVLGAQHLLLSWLYAEFDATLGLQRPYYAVAQVIDGVIPGAEAASICMCEWVNGSNRGEWSSILCGWSCQHPSPMDLGVSLGRLFHRDGG